MSLVAGLQVGEVADGGLGRRRRESVARGLGSSTNVGALRGARVAVDLLAVASAMAIAFWLREIPLSVRSHLLLGGLSLPVWCVMLGRARLYSEPHIAGRLDEFRRIVNASLCAVGVMAVMGFVLKLYVSRVWLASTAVIAVATLTAARDVVRRTIARLRRRGRYLHPVLVVGGNVEALSVCSMLAGAPTLGYRCVGFVDDDAPVGTALIEGQAVLGPIRDVLAVAEQTRAMGVVIATTAVPAEESNRLTRQLTSAGLQVELSSSLCDIASTRLFVRPLGRFPVLHVDPVRRNGWQMRAKRVFDLAGASLAGVLIAPVLAIAALAIKLDSRGPAHFRQRRVGLNGDVFEVLKLRTMVVDAERMMEGLLDQNQADGPLFKVTRDPRVTRVGRVLRALSIDELPQLWNVLRGEMSLVGPRPALPREVPMWSPELHGRLTVRPGMTGMWQVSGSRRWHSFDEYARLDLYYVDNWSIWTDLAILAKTIPAVLRNRPEA